MDAEDMGSKCMSNTKREPESNMMTANMRPKEITTLGEEQIRLIYAQHMKKRETEEFKARIKANPKLKEEHLLKKKYEQAKDKAMKTYMMAEDFVTNHVCDNSFRDKLLFELKKVKQEIETTTLTEKMPTEVALKKRLYNILIYYVAV